MKNHVLHLIGAAIGIGALDRGCADGPAALQSLDLSQKLLEKGVDAQWKDMLFALPDLEGKKILPEVARFCTDLAGQTFNAVKEEEWFAVLGGDHSCAIGTWSGVSAAIQSYGQLGLIWIDAHMDSHTFETTESDTIHGMPLAALLGHGDESLTQILNTRHKVSPEQVCLIGVRSYEVGEARLLKELGVRCYFMDEINQRGLNKIMQEAKEIVNKGTIGFGVSIDLDAIDPNDVPGIGSPVANGFSAKDLIGALHCLVGDEQLLGFEIAEFNPNKDIDNKTATVVEDLIVAINK